MLVVSPFNSFTPPHFILTVKTDNSGVSNSNQFTLPTVVGLTYDYQIDWGDGTVEYYTTDAPQTHTYTVPGTYEIQIYGTFPKTNFVLDQPVDFGKVIKIKDLGRVGWAGSLKFEELINLTEITNPGDTSGITSFAFSFSDNRSLTSFPLINTSSGTDFKYAWQSCSSLTSFPLIDTSSGTNFRYAWFNCSSLTSFPANFFDNWVGKPINQCFRYTWDACTNLTAQSVENILVSIDTSGVNAPGGATAGDNYIEIDYNVSTGGLTAATNTAITNLKGKGWEPFINGVLV